MQRILGLVLPLALLLAGCADDPAAPHDDGAAAPSPVPSAAAVPWGLDGCTFLIGFVPVDADLLAAHLPEGFTPAPGMVPGAGPVLGVEVFTCAGGLGLDGSTIQPLAYGSYFASADPPEDLVLEGTPTYWVKWDTLVPDAPRREALAAAGLPARAGSTSLSGEPGVVSATLELDGVGTFTVTGRGLSPPVQAAGPGKFAEFTPTATGLARWNASAVDMSQSLGAGVVTVPAGSLAAELIGAETAAATVMAGGWSFVDGQTVLRVR